MKTERLATLYENEGPFASVTLDVSHDNENAAHEHDLRVRAARAELLEQGSDGAVADTVCALLAEQVREPSPVARVVVANAGGVVFDEVMHTRVDQPVVSWGPLPDVAAWIEHEDGTTPFVLAIVDHEGGDVAVYTSDVPDPEDEGTVGGETQHVHKVPTGGWSALRYQHVTENVWKRNAEAVSQEILAHVRSGVHLVLLAGDPQSRTQVVDGLGDEPATVIELEGGSRSRDGGDQAFQQSIRETLLERAVSRRVEISHTLKDRLGRDSAVATGVDDVADAFVRGQVDTLLLDPRPAAELTLSPKKHPGLALGPASDDETVRADQGLVAAAALTGADVAVSRQSTLGGTPVAALLRWDQAAEGTTTKEDR